MANYSQLSDTPTHIECYYRPRRQASDNDSNMIGAANVMAPDREHFSHGHSSRQEFSISAAYGKSQLRPSKGHWLWTLSNGILEGFCSQKGYINFEVLNLPFWSGAGELGSNPRCPRIHPTYFLKSHVLPEEASDFLNFLSICWSSNTCLFWSLLRMQLKVLVHHTEVLILILCNLT